MSENYSQEDAERALQVEALLFALGESVSRPELTKLFETDAASLERAIQYLNDAAKMNARGVVLVDDGKEVALRAAPQAADFIERVRKEEYSRDIGKAGLEVLAAILYQGPLTRSKIDFIRGVNSAQTLRTLSMRGLVRKVQNPKDERSFLYEPTTELLSQLGVSQGSDLPEYDRIREKLASLKEDPANPNVPDLQEPI